MATRPFDFAESREGYEKLDREFEKLASRHPHVHFHIRVDAAGQYTMNLERFIRALPWNKTVSIGEPKRNKDYKNVHFPKRKSDCVDSHACARFAIVERPPGTLEVPVEFHQLRELASALESQTKRTTRLVNQWHNRLSRVFPELALIASRLSTAWVLRLMRKYPTPQRIAAARASSLSAMPHIDTDRAEQPQTAAQKTTGSMSGPLIEEIIRVLADEIIASQKAGKTLLDLLTQGFDALPSRGQQHLLSIPGIGRQTAAALAAKMVTIDRFETPDALVSYFGVFPEENTSGVDGPSTFVKQPSDSCVGWIDFAQLRAQVSMQAVLEKLNLLPHLSGSGPQRRGPCPIHMEQRGPSQSHSRNRSFSVNLQKHAFQCFYPPCGAHGNVLDLWAAVHQLPLPQAASHLSETFQLQFNPNREEEPVPRKPSPSPQIGASP
ncbi:MAG: transposase [Planctomycetes bacterium]|nr:transposase [Planctomycetota bacterium]